MGNSEFAELAKEFVAEFINLNFFDGDGITEDDVYIVWICKTLQNNKALLSTDKVKDLYFEFTWNGDKAEGYLDAYKKVKNVVIRSEE